MSPTLHADFLVRFPPDSEIRAANVSIPRETPVTVLFGPSGSGKTTVLRALAGLLRPASGVIQCRGTLWFDSARRVHRPPRQRQIGFVPQDYALFPHRNVTHNVAYGLADLPRAERRRRVSDTLEWLGISELRDRMPHTLSGGQRQRVALARAVATRPRLLLLDEPLSALDAPTRHRLRGELRAALLSLGIPTIMVTHDRSEALAVGDRLIVMDHGRIRQQGEARTVFSQPADTTVASILAIETILPGRVTRQSGDLLHVQVGQAGLLATAPDPTSMPPDVIACIRSEDVTLALDDPPRTSARNHLRALILAIHEDGPLARVEMDCGFPLTAVVTRTGRDDLRLRPNLTVHALIKASAIHLIPQQPPARPPLA